MTPSLPRASSRAMPAAHGLAARHPRLAELRASFPALFQALACPRARFDAEPVIAGAIGGAPLAALAEQARVPLWLRKVRPEMFNGAIPALPDSPFLRRRIVNHLPTRPKLMANWLSVVAEAAELAHEPFVLWCARLAADDADGVPAKRLRRLALWAWYSCETSTRAHDFITRRWSPGIERKAALEAAQDWVQTLDLQLWLGGRAIEDVWLRPGNVDGFDFRPLRTAEDLVAEARARRNCVRSYGYGLAHGNCRLWRVERRGKGLATMCTCWRGQDPLPSVCQIALANNGQAPVEMWLAARKWLAGQELLHLNKRERQKCRAAPDAAMWRTLWRPWWLARRRIPDWLPLRPLADLDTL
jgi:hypothetical protein